MRTKRLSDKISRDLLVLSHPVFAGGLDLTQTPTAHLLPCIVDGTLHASTPCPEAVAPATVQDWSTTVPTPPHCSHQPHQRAVHIK